MSIYNKKRESHYFVTLFNLLGSDLLFHILVAVSSAIKGLTSLFGMVRGDHLLYNCQKYLLRFN